MTWSDDLTRKLTCIRQYLRIYVGDAFGIVSERSQSMRTAAPSVPEAIPGVVAATSASGTCMQLQWLAPRDDGGRSVTSYLFAIREHRDASTASLMVKDDDPHKLDKYERLEAVVVSAASTGTTAAAGAWLSALVCNQIPGQSLQIRVAAVNSIGMSEWSQLSGLIIVAADYATPAARVIPTIRGRNGDQDFSGIIPSNSLNQTSSSSLRLPRILLSDVHQQIVVTASGATTDAQFDVWAGHFSPRRFHVSSQLVLADPLDASEPLRNADDVRGRVVLVARGQVPFVFKLHHAQLAGALGVVVADVDGLCRHGFDQHCVPGASKHQGEGFGGLDRHPLWSRIRIPFVLALQDASNKLLDLLGPLSRDTPRS